MIDQESEYITDQETKVKENRLRRIAQRRGYRLEKSRRRDPKAIDYDGFMLVDALKNFAVFGYHPFAYSASIDDVESYLDEEPGVRLGKAKRKAK